MAKKQELKKIIEESSLTEAEKDFWFIFIDNCQSEQLEVIFQFIQEEKNGLEIVNKNLKSKFLAFSQRNKKSQERIIEEEEKILS